MTDRIDAAIKAIAPRFESANRYPVQKATVPIEEWQELLLALMAATPAPAQPEGAQEDEPVAWRISASTVLPVGELTAIKGRADLAKHLGYAVEPLYLHPSRSAGAAAPVEGATCQHAWCDARNQYVLSGEFCLRCGAVRGGNQLAAPASPTPAQEGKT